MLKRISGISNLQTPPKTASTAFFNGQSVKFSGSTGFIVPAAATDTIHYGIVQQTIAATDGDYAKNTNVLVDMFDQGQVIEADVTNGGAAVGTLAATDVGQYFKIDAAATPASTSIDSATRTTTPSTGGAIFVCIAFINPSKGLFKVLPANAA